MDFSELCKHNHCSNPLIKKKKKSSLQRSVDEIAMLKFHYQEFLFITSREYDTIFKCDTILNLACLSAKLLNVFIVKEEKKRLSFPYKFV